MSEGRPRRRWGVLVVGVIMMIAGAVVISVSQTAFAAKTVRFKSFASGNAFAMSDEQVMNTLRVWRYVVAHMRRRPPPVRSPSLRRAK